MSPIRDDIKSLILVVALTGLVVVGLPLQGEANIAVSDLHLNFTVAPGNTASKSFRVTNREQGPTQIEISLYDWIKKESGDTKLLPPGVSERSLSAFIAFRPVSFTLEEGQSQEVTVDISVPTGETGPHWSLLLVDSSTSLKGEAETGEGSIGVSFSPAFGIKIRQEDPNDATTGGQILNTHILPPSSSEQVETFRARVKFENTGTTFLNPEAWVVVKDRSGETVVESEKKEFRLLPGFTSHFEIPFGDESKLNPGQYLALIMVDYGGDRIVANQKQFTVDSTS